MQNYKFVFCKIYRSADFLVERNIHEFLHANVQVWARFIRGSVNEKHGMVARPEACPLGMQVATSSIPTSGTFFRGDLVMKTFLRPFSLFR